MIVKIEERKKQEKGESMSDERIVCKLKGALTTVTWE